MTHSFYADIYESDPSEEESEGLLSEDEDLIGIAFLFPSPLLLTCFIS